MTLACDWDEYALRVATCNSTGERFELQCRGRAEQQTFTCETTQGMTCALWSGSAWDSTSCVEVVESSHSLTCKCSGLGSFTSTSSTGGSSSLSVDIAAVGKSISDVWISTSAEAALLSPYTFSSKTVFMWLGKA